MAIHPLAGMPAPKELLIDPEKLARDYFENRPDPADPNQLVSFGTSGHRGTASNCTFNEWHILAITQAICNTAEPTTSRARCSWERTRTRCRSGAADRARSS